MSMASIAEGDDGLSSFRQGGKNFNLYGNIMPFSQVKNKWISGLTFEAGNWFCNVDGRANADLPATGNSVDNGCGAFSIRDHGDGGRQILIQTGDLGKGWVFARGAGIRYQVGPNTLRLAYTKESAADDGGTRASKRSKGWIIGDDLFMWSPKGFLTGSATTPGSILFGTHFERANLDIDCSNTPRGGQHFVLPDRDPQYRRERDDHPIPSQHGSVERVGFVVLHRATHERWNQYPVVQRD